MALNWVTLDPHQRPLPLSGEKIFLEVASVTASIRPASAPAAAKALSATGTAFISNKRFVYVSSTPQGAGGLSSLSSPLSHFQDGRFVQPFFAANYYEAVLRPVPDGGLSEPHTIRLDFREGRGFEFASAVEEVKARFDQQHRPQEVEALPLYEEAAPTPAGQPDRPVPAQASYFPEPMPPASDMEAAATAREQEEEECEQREAEVSQPPGYLP